VVTRCLARHGAVRAAGRRMERREQPMSRWGIPASAAVRGRSVRRDREAQMELSELVIRPGASPALLRRRASSASSRRPCVARSPGRQTQLRPTRQQTQGLKRPPRLGRRCRRNTAQEVAAPDDCFPFAALESSHPSRSSGYCGDGVSTVRANGSWRYLVGPYDILGSGPFKRNGCAMTRGRDRAYPSARGNLLRFRISLRDRWPANGLPSTRS
jgi:hypothetical protein